MFHRIGMFIKRGPPFSAMLILMLSAVAVQLVYLRLYQFPPPQLFDLFIPAVVLVCLSLLLRIMDEYFKPLPLKQVKPGDLMFLGIYCAVLVLALNIYSLTLVLWILLILSYAALMMKWSAMANQQRDDLPLNMVSRLPLVVLYFFYLIIACTQIDQQIGWGKVLYLLPLSLMISNWEILRRTPDRTMMTLALLLQLTFNASALITLQAIEANKHIMMVFVLLQILLMAPSFYFLISAKEPFPWKRLAQAQMLVVVVALLSAAKV